MARIFRGRFRRTDDTPVRRGSHWFGIAGMTLALAGWGLALPRWGMSRHALAESAPGMAVAAAGLVLSIVGVGRRSWTGWLGICMAIGPAVLLALYFGAILLLYVGLQAAGTPGL